MDIHQKKIHAVMEQVNQVILGKETEVREMMLAFLADELNRTTNALTAALQQVDQLAASAQGADTRGLKRGLHQMNSNAAELDRAYAQQTKIMAKAAGGAAHRYDQELQELLGEVPNAVPATGTPGGIPQSDEELQAELDAINQNLYRILDET